MNGRQTLPPPRWKLWAALLAVALPLAARAAGVDAPIAHSMPTSGRYEILLPGDPKNVKDSPVVLYLHPSSAPALDKARELYWPVFRDRKCVMVMPVSQSPVMWRSGEDKFVMDVLADVRTRYGTDPKRVILMGVSGGGQVALFLADHSPEQFRAVIAINANPVVVRGQRSDWFYPDRAVLKTCPYFVINALTEGSALMYWRQVQAKLNPLGASITVWPVVAASDALPPLPKELPAWLDTVLAGRQPAPLADGQKSAVALMFDAAAKALPGELEKAAQPARPDDKIVQDGKFFRLTVTSMPAFERGRGEARTDAQGRAITQVRLEHVKWPITVRFDARVTDNAYDSVLLGEEAQTAARGLLYQVYQTGAISAAGRKWEYRVGSITYPDKARGWVSALFILAAAPIESNPRQWLSVMVDDETQQPNAAELAGILRGAIEGVAATPTPASAPAPTPSRK